MMLPRLWAVPLCCNDLQETAACSYGHSMVSAETARHRDALCNLCLAASCGRLKKKEPKMSLPSPPRRPICGSYQQKHLSLDGSISGVEPNHLGSGGSRHTLTPVEGTCISGSTTR
jgi:hypothetical protein